MTRFITLVALSVLALGPAALAQETPAAGKAGYGDVPEFGGPQSVTGELKEADEERDAIADWAFFDGYFDWKRQIKDDYGVSFGIHMYGLFQQAGDSLPGDRRPS